jgi:hypothetical protein
VDIGAFEHGDLEAAYPGDPTVRDALTVSCLNAWGGSMASLAYKREDDGTITYEQVELPTTFGPGEMQGYLPDCMAVMLDTEAVTRER